MSGLFLSFLQKKISYHPLVDKMHRVVGKGLEVSFGPRGEQSASVFTNYLLGVFQVPGMFWTLGKLQWTIQSCWLGACILVGIYTINKQLKIASDGHESRGGNLAGWVRGHCGGWTALLYRMAEGQIGDTWTGVKDGPLSRHLVEQCFWFPVLVRPGASLSMFSYTSISIGKQRWGERWSLTFPSPWIRGLW